MEFLIKNGEISMIKKDDNEITEMLKIDSQKKKNEWRRKGWSIPDLRGGKKNWFILSKTLIQLVSQNKVIDLDSKPMISEISEIQTWRNYMPFLKGLGLVSNQSGILYLSKEGLKFLNNPTKRQLADIIQDKIRLFGEVLNLISLQPLTIEEVNKKVCKEYGLQWANLSHIRKRMDWLEVLGLIEGIGNRKWEISTEGKKALNSWNLISPDVLEPIEIESNEVEIASPPEEIAILLQRLSDFPELHKKRNTYNIWAPSPNRIENLRIIIQSATDKISKNELFRFISEEFKLKISSVESMLPFLKASGFIEEVGRGIYISTSAAKAWLETGNDLDFVRILHAHMQFVGEMIDFAKTDVVRNNMYARAKIYGLNTEKARWIAGFLIEAGLLEETQYLHLKATPLGIYFANSLPLLKVNEVSFEKEKNEKEIDDIISVSDKFKDIVDRLTKTSRDPGAEGKALGVAFEEAIAEMFNFMGFEAKRIGGAGDTDVIARWRDSEGKNITAIIDAKSKSGGQVTHNDISDVAIDTHKDKNNADYVAIVGAKFGGDTIKNHAQKKGFALITTDQLIAVAEASKKLGLSLQDISLLFEVPNGFSELAERISSKQRELDILSMVILKFCKEQDQIGALSPRDLFLLLRDTSESPTLKELIDAFELLSSVEIGVLKAVDENRLPENTMYMLIEAKKSIARLRAISNAIEKGIIS